MKIKKTLFKTEVEVGVKEISELINLYQDTGFISLREFIDYIIK